jgi:hypothetical protein
MTKKEEKEALGWMAEHERRLAQEGLSYGVASDLRPEQEERRVNILRDVLAEVKSGKGFNDSEVLSQWHADDEARERARASQR